MTPLIEKLYRRLPQDYDSVSCALQPNVYAKHYLQDDSLSYAEKCADGFSEFLRTKPLYLHSDDLFAGQIQFCNVPYSTPYIHLPVSESKYYAFPYIGDEDHQHRLNAVAEIQSEEDRKVLDDVLNGSLHGLYVRGPIGHVIPGFDRLLQKGFIGIEKEIIESSERDHSDDESAMLRAMHTCVSAARGYALRYAEQAEKLASESSEEARKRLLRIADACRNISAGRADSFFEAVQTIILMQELITTETPSGSLSLGRVDQMLYPYYKHDLERGKITYDTAREYIDAFRLKLGAMPAGYQNVTIGGCDRHGKWSGNDITTMFMDSALEIRIDQPLLSLRCTDDMPDAVWSKALELMSIGDGFPALFNDRIVLASLKKHAVDDEDAWNYGIVGCVEPSIPGKEFSNTEEMRVSWAKALELTLNDGKCRLSGIRLIECTKRASDCRTFEEFKALFMETLRTCLENAMRSCDLIDHSFCKRYPIPFLSASMAGCIESGCDAASDRGTVYRRTSINHTGMANAVDSLIAVKELVYDTGAYTIDRLNEILNGNFADDPQLLQTVTSKTDRLGNNPGIAGDLLKELCDFAAEIILNRKNCRNDLFRMGMYSVSHHATLGKENGALPCGTTERTALANGMSPVQGADRFGPTSVILDICRPDHTDWANGMVLDLKFTPALFSEKNRDAIRAMIRTYFRLGGMELQCNVIDKATLLEAKKDPEKYRNLLVRVSGFSAYFVTLDEIVQDEIIARTEHAAC